MESHHNNVGIVSTETIKPEPPTPCHLRKLMTFSLLDQKHSPMIIPTLLFYAAPVGAMPLDIVRLKSCLAQTLSIFYPLAGRYETWGTTTLCNDEGVPFVEARVNCPLDAVLKSLSSSSDDIDLLSFYPPKEKLISSGTHLAIQISVFTCGGFALGWYHTHKVTDAISAATFLRHWAALVTGRYEDAAQAVPDFNAGAIAYPPIPEEDKPDVMAPTEEQHGKKNVPRMKRIVVRSYVFGKSALAKLQAESRSEKVANPSRFLALTGFIWQQLLLASPGSDQAGKSVAFLTVDLRSRCDPVLPKGSMGNLVEMALARAEKQTTFQELVAEIHESISKLKDIVAEYRGDKRAEAKEKHWQNFLTAVKECKGKDVYAFSAWCKSAGFSDIDFGFGKPEWIVPIDDKLRHEKTRLIMVTDYKDSKNGDVFEAWLLLEEEQIKSLESNPDFLAIASSRF